MSTEAKRKEKYERNARFHAMMMGCHEQARTAAAGDILEIPSASVPNRTDLVVVIFPTVQHGPHVLSYGSGLIVRNAHGEGYDPKASRKLADDLSAVVKQLALPEGLSIDAWPSHGTDAAGFPVDKPETGVWLHFEFPPLDADGEPVPLKPYKPAKERGKERAKLAETTGADSIADTPAAVPEPAAPKRASGGKAAAVPEPAAPKRASGGKAATAGKKRSGSKTTTTKKGAARKKTPPKPPAPKEDTQAA